MSQKITAKNLTYDTSLPPFLARLHGHRAAQTGPDPILASHRRPGQQRSASEEAEDAPLVVDENGNVVDLEQPAEEIPDRGEKEKEEEEAGGEKGRESKDKDREGDGGKEREKVAAIGASRKRKVGRVIGDEGSSDDETKTGTGRGRGKEKRADEDAKARIAKASADVRRLIRAGPEDGEEEREATTNTNAAANTKTTDDQRKTIKSTKKKTAKKIKLSFGDND
ncbi:hypothetical protein GGR50DRAFT_313941 [Xylaria sp. CBS 124048]|nr:hypothetical protein GGR50DRAFT_313941 [Xylaria sp. CBS 124048]